MPSRLPRIRHREQLLAPVDPAALGVNLERDTTGRNELVQPRNVDAENARSRGGTHPVRRLWVVERHQGRPQLQRQRLRVGAGHLVVLVLRPR